VVDFVSLAGRVQTWKVDLLSLCRDKHQGVSSIRLEMKSIRRRSTSKCISLSLFCALEHHQGEFSRWIDEHIREALQRYTLGHREKMKKRWSIRTANVHLIDRTERKEKMKKRTHTHTIIIVQSIDTQGDKKNLRYDGIEAYCPV
jgi:hypothetical protein